MIVTAIVKYYNSEYTFLAKVITKTLIDETISATAPTLLDNEENNDIKLRKTKNKRVRDTNSIYGEIKKSANESVFKEINLCNPNTILIDKTVDKENQESRSTIIHEPCQTISNSK